MVDDTIVAVATPAGHAARAVVRLSGPDALACAEARFHPRTQSAADWRLTYRATPGHLALTGEGVGVPALLYVMRAPHSYTREDVVEAHVPGSPALLDLMLDDLLEHGPGDIRLAEPGEFTRRAFLNGRIDLAQAEAVLAVIRARGESELLAATSRLRGSMGRRCVALQEAVTDLRVRAEAALDFAEHGIELLSEGELVARCEAIGQEMAAEARKGRGELAGDGSIHVVLCGPPNAGKSSLLNRLAGAERAIVHHRAGTTRDAVGAEIEVAGACFRLTDTAGLAARPRGVEAEAVRRAREHAAGCQLLLFVVDGSAEALQGMSSPAELPPRERVLCVVNKCDMPQVLDEAPLGGGEFAYATLHTSALTGEGIDELRDALGRMVAEGRLDASAADCLFNARQRGALRKASAEIGAAAEAVGSGLGYEFAAVNLRVAADALAEVTGAVAAQDVLDRIFSQFCIGK